jgi:hypothetical protein
VRHDLRSTAALYGRLNDMSHRPVATGGRQSYLGAQLARFASRPSGLITTPGPTDLRSLSLATRSWPINYVPTSRPGFSTHLAGMAAFASQSADTHQRHCRQCASVL